MAPESFEVEPLASITDYERAAEAELTPGALAYYAGGAGDELTLRDNAAAWQRLTLRPRVLVPVAQCDPSVTVLGKSHPHPLIIAPMAFQGLVHEQGELATARAAQATATTMCVSTFATVSLAALAQAVPACPRWFQLYVLADRGLTRELVAQAVEHDYEALVVTVDLPVVGVRDRELRTPVDAPQPRHLAEEVAADLSWNDIAELVSECPLPVIVKGILAAEDARLAASLGARAVVVSNHGGRQLDTVSSSAEALPEVVEAVGGGIDVLVDGGIRRGTDVVKALALGASAVMVGRPVAWGLAVAGAQGAQRVLELLLDELEVALALTGRPRASELDSTVVAARDR